MVNLSIIIPHYNSTVSLNRLLETIPDLEEIEVVVIDDRSDIEQKNELLKIEEKNSHRNIRFLSNESDKKNAGTCRNIGLNHASGKWVLFADADDYFMDDFFDAIKKYFHSTHDVIFFKPTSIDIETGEISNRHIPFVELIDNQLKNQSLASEIRLRYFFSVPWSKLINMNLIKKNNIYFDEVIASNDVMFSTKIGYYMNNFLVTDERIYCVTKSKGSLTTTLSNEIFDARLKVHICYYNFLKDYCLNREEFKLIKLNLSGRSLFIKSLRLGYRKAIFVFKMLKENNVHIVDLKLFNPILALNKLLLFYSEINKEKKYTKRIEDRT